MYLVSTEKKLQVMIVDRYLGLKISPNLTVLFLDKTCNRVLSRFLIELDIKPGMHLVEISIFSLNNVTVKLTKIMNNLEHLKILIF